MLSYSELYGIEFNSGVGRLSPVFGLKMKGIFISQSGVESVVRSTSQMAGAS